MKDLRFLCKRLSSYRLASFALPRPQTCEETGRGLCWRRGYSPRQAKSCWPLFPAHLDSCTVPSPSLSPSISFKASALAEGRRKRRSQWRWRWRSGQEKVRGWGVGRLHPPSFWMIQRTILSTVSSFMSSSSAKERKRLTRNWK